MDVAVKVVPIALIFFLGMVLRSRGVAKKEDGEFLLRLNFYVALPAVTILGLASTKLQWHLALFPLIGTITILVTMATAFLLGKRLPFNRQTVGVFIIGSMIINTGFTLPFLIATYGHDGLVRKVIFDVATDTLSFTLMYYIACRFGEKKQDASYIAKKVFLSPAVFAVVIGVTLSLFSIRLPAVATNFLTPFAGLIQASILLALGIYFQPGKLKFPRIAYLPLAIRSLGGLLVGLVLTRIFMPKGMDRTIALVLVSAPIGYMTLTLASLEKLNVEYAATIASLSAFVGALYIPILLVLLA